MDNHHGDNRVAPWRNAPPGAQVERVEASYRRGAPRKLPAPARVDFPRPGSRVRRLNRCLHYFAPLPEAGMNGISKG